MMYLSFSPPLNKRIQNPFLTRFIKINRQLVPVHQRYVPVAKFQMKHAVSNFEVGAGFVDGGGY
jgi:hypothetical protein